MVNYFANINDLDELKKRWRKIAKKLHPDVNKSANATSLMQAVNNQYDELNASLIRQTRPGLEEKEYTDLAKVDIVLRTKISLIINFDNIEISIKGQWLWVSGNTKPYDKLFRAAGFKFSKRHLQWFYAGVPSRSRGKMSMDYINRKYPPTTVKKNKDEEKQKQL